MQPAISDFADISIMQFPSELYTGFPSSMYRVSRTGQPDINGLFISVFRLVVSFEKLMLLRFGQSVNAEAPTALVCDVTSNDVIDLSFTVNNMTRGLLRFPRYEAPSNSL